MNDAAHIIELPDSRPPADTGCVPPQRPNVLMLGPAAPEMGGMVTSIDLLMNGPLRRYCRLHRCAGPGTGRSRATGRDSRGGPSRLRHLPGGLARHGGALLRLATAITTRRIDLVHIHTCSYFTFFRNLLDLRLARRLGCAVVLHIRGGQFEHFCQTAGKSRQRAIRRGCESADAVIVLSEHWREALQPHLGEARMYVVPNGVELPGRPSRGKPNSRICRFLYLASLTHAKGLEDLIAAAGLLRSRGLRFELVIAGPSPEQPCSFWQQRARAAGLESTCTFTGPVTGKDKSDLLASADCFVHPSHCEGLPNAVLEAAAAGLPVIATAVGSLPEVMRAGSGGGELSPLVPPRDPVALSEQMHLLARDAALRQQVARRLHAHVVEHYNLERVSELIARVYAQVLARRARSSARCAVPAGVLRALEVNTP
jgi:glycosyltransferase involved in cell wall biosynthesis